MTEVRATERMMSSDALREFLAKARGSLDRQINTDVAELWGLAALRGRLVELSARGASATMTTAVDLILEAQVAAEPVAWIAQHSASFYPPDVAESGVDLAALVVVRVPDAMSAARSAERLLRSGAFGLVIIDVGVGDISMALQGRLVSLAQTHDAAVVCLTEKSADTASIGSLVSLRAEALRARAGKDFDLTVRCLKDKRRGPGWTKKLKARGPAGF